MKEARKPSPVRVGRAARPLVRGLNHVTLAVTDLGRSIRFYERVLDGTLAHAWEAGAYLQIGDTWLCLSLDPAAAHQPRTDYTHVAFDIDAQDVEAFRRRAADFGSAEWRENTSEGASVYVLDPDGHRLEAHAGTLQTRLAALRRVARAPGLASPRASVPEIRTERLLLRRWRPSDVEPLAALHADPRVMRYLGGPRTRGQTGAFIARMETHHDEHGFGVWAVELLESGVLAGGVGLSEPRFEAHFTPCVEAVWRLAHAFHGRGIATEAARAAIDTGFRRIGLEEIVAMTVPRNVASIRVMERLGMTRDPADEFDHPLMPAGDPLRRHRLYRLRASDLQGG